MRTIRLNYLWRLLQEAAKLDLFELNYEFGCEALNTLSLGGYWGKANGLPRKGIAVRVGIFLWHFCTSLIACWHRSDTNILPGGVVFFALSKNEIDSLMCVYSQMPKAYLAGSNETPFPFPFVWGYALSFAYLPLVTINYLKAKGYRRRSFAFVFDQYWLIYGLYIAARMWLNDIKPKVLILANQVHPYHRVMLKAACEEGIRTVYLPHACTPDKFPPLTADFDYALLEGWDALSKMARGGTTRTRTFLIGIPKHDSHFQHINGHAQVYSIGLCTNNADPLIRTEELLAWMQQECATVSFILRPHDSDPRMKEWKDLARRNGVEFSDSKTEISFEYLRKVDAIIAGDSNILLEAALMNVVPMYYDYAHTHLDWYGFERNGMVEYFSEPNQVCRCIKAISKSKPLVRMKARVYCATVGTRYDGRSGELAAELLQSLASSTQVNESIWKRIPDIGLDAYGPDDMGELTVTDRNL